MLRTTGLLGLFGLLTTNCAGGQSFDDGSNPLESSGEDTPADDDTPSDDDTSSADDDAGTSRPSSDPAAGGSAETTDDGSAGSDSMGGTQSSVGAAAGAGGSADAGGAGGTPSMAGTGGSLGAAGSGAAGSGAVGGSAGEGGSAADGSGQWVWQSRAATASNSTLTTLWTDAADSVWAAGNSGAMIHFDGDAWSAVDAATRSGVYGLWGSGPSDVWAVAGGFSGEGAANLVHFDGDAWSVVDPGTTANLVGIWGSGADDVWVTGRFDGVLHFDGNAWSVEPSGPAGMEGLVAGSGPDDVWIARSGSSLSHSTGDGQWLPLQGPSLQGVSGLWVNAPDDAWTVNYLEAMHWDGAEWSVLTDPALPGANAVWGSASEQVTAVGADATIYEWDGASWSNVMSAGADLRAVGGSDASNRWAVGDLGTVFRFEADLGELTCGRVGGVCAAEDECDTGQGHLSDFACDGDGAVCCVDANACGGGEPECCDADQVRSRPICHNGEFRCMADSAMCPLTP